MDCGNHNVRVNCQQNNEGRILARREEQGECLKWPVIVLCQLMLMNTVHPVIGAFSGSRNCQVRPPSQQVGSDCA